MSYRILITEPVVGEVIDFLRNHAEVVVGDRGSYYTEDSLIEALGDYDAVISMLSTPMSRRVLESSERLKVVANYAVGYNNVDVNAAKELGIRVTNTPGALTEATADIAWALILATIRHIPASETFLREGKFDGWDPLGFLGYDLNGKTLGIIGMGRIGQAVARRAVGFGMNTIYHNRKPVSAEIEQSLSATYVDDYKDLVRKSDVVSLNCPLTPENRHMIDREMLQQMKRSSVLINTGRGPLIDEAALAEALKSGWIAGAGLDVYEEEPVVHQDLLDATNAVLIPHIGSATYETRIRMGMLAAKGLLHLLNGGDGKELPNLLV
jgi:glyoxylate reductase